MKYNPNELIYYTCNKSSTLKMKEEVFTFMNIKKIRIPPSKVNPKFIFKGY